MSSTAFIEWARKNAIPSSIPATAEDLSELAALGPIIGASRVVWCGEPSHWIGEWIRFRVRLFQYLVHEKGFRTFVFETGFVESKLIHDYVLGRNDDWDRVVSEGFEWSFGLFEEWQDLVRWMRAYNDDAPEDQKLRFYGMDGTGVWADATRAFEGVHDFLSKVDAETAAAFDRFPSLVSGATLKTAWEIPQSEWDRLLAGTARLVAHLDRRRIDYISASSEEDYAWARIYARVGQCVLSTLAAAAKFPWDGGVVNEEGDAHQAWRILWEGRDAAMTEQLMWILDREGVDSGFVIGAANNHLQQTPMAGWVATIGAYMGTLLPRDRMFFIGTESEQSVRAGETPPEDSLPAALSEVVGDGFILDLRHAPREGPVADWLHQPHGMRANHMWIPCAASPSFDVLFFARRVGLATLALPPSLTREMVSSSLSVEDWVGTYDVVGFMGMEVVLDFEVEDGHLVVDASQDLIGEVYPPKRTRLFPISDRKFGCADWPAVTIFERHEPGQPRSITIDIPGFDTYPGTRRES